MGRIKFKYGINDVHGNFDELVIYYSKYFKRNITRVWVKPKESEANRKFKTVHRNLGIIWREASDGYKRDFRVYSEFFANATDHRQPFYSFFLQMFWAWKKSHPEEDLANLSKQDICERDLPMKSIAKAIEAGLLPTIPIEGIGINEI